MASIKTFGVPFVKVIGTELYQWETGRKLLVTGKNITHLHFAHKDGENSLVVIPKEENGVVVAEIPNILMQSNQDIMVFSVNVVDDKTETIKKCVLSVEERPKPDDYVYTETEVLNFSTLEKRIQKLETEPGGGECQIKYVESLDENNLVNLRDLESDLYMLYGYFKPFPGSNSTLIIDRGFYMVTRVAAGSHLLSISPLNFKMTCHEILVDDTNEKGFTYTNTRINLLDINNAVAEMKNGVELADRTTGTKYKLYVDDGKLTMEESEG